MAVLEAGPERGDLGAGGASSANPTSLPASGTSPANISPVRIGRDVVPRVLLLMLTFLLGCFEMACDDTWWHLAAGDLIRKTGKTPTTDPFSYTSKDNEWVDVHWGFQVLFSWLHQHWGVPGMVLAKAVICTIAVGIGLTAYRRHWSAATQVLVWLPAVLLMSARFYVRPEILTLLWTACFLSILFHAERRPRLLLLLPFIQVVWANSQGLFIFGPILISMYVAEAFFRVGQLRGVFRCLIPTTIGVFGACLVSPYGFKNALLVIELSRKMDAAGQIFRDHIAELQDLFSFWSTGGHANPYVWLLLGLIGLEIVGVIVSARIVLGERRLFWLLPMLAFSLLAFKATRNGNHFAMVAGAGLAWMFGARSADRPQRGWGPWLAGLATLAVGYLVVHGEWYSWVGGQRRTGLIAQPDLHAREAIEFAGQAGLPKEAAVFHLAHAAEYIHSNGPFKKVMMDARLEVHSEELFRQYIELEDSFAQRDARPGDVTWEQRLAKFDVNLVVAGGERQHPIQAALLSSTRWKCLYQDERAGVYVSDRWILPTHLQPINFPAQLFESPRTTPMLLPTPTPRPRWWFFPPPAVEPDLTDLAAQRYFNLGMELTARRTADLRTQQAILWLAAQQAVRSQERRPWEPLGRRVFGLALMQLTRLYEPGAEGRTLKDRWSAASDLLPALAVSQLRRALEAPTEYSARFALVDYYSRLGAADECYRLVDELCSLPTTNATRITLAKSLRESRDQWKKHVDDARKQLRQRLPRDPAAMTGEQPIRSAELAVFMEVGLVAEGLAKVRFDRLEDWSGKQLDQLGVWCLKYGRPDWADRAYQKLDSLGHDATFTAHRLGLSAFCSGDGAAAERHWRSIGASAAEATEVRLGRALLRLLASDRAGMLEAISSPPESTPRIWRMLTDFAKVEG